MKKFRKPAALALSLLMALSCATVLPVSGDISTVVAQAAEQSGSVSWNMSDTAFRDLGTIKSTTTIDGLSLVANSSKSLKVKSDSETVDGYDYSYCLALGGTGSTSYRAMSVNVSGQSTIKVTARSSSSSTRTLNITDESGNILGTISCAPEASTGSATISYDGTVYIYSANSGINVYKVQVDSKGGEVVTEATTEETTEATTKEETTEATTKKVVETTTEATTKDSTSDETSSSSKSWNMGNSSFNSLGTISSTTEIDGLELVATSAKTMSVKGEDVSVDGKDYSYCLALGGSGSTSYRAAALDVSGTTTLKITARSSGSSTRTIVIADENGSTIDTIDFAKTASLGTSTFSYTGKVYIYSANSGINIYKIQADTKGGTEVTTKKETTTEATTKKTETTTKKTETTTKKVETTTEATTVKKETTTETTTQAAVTDGKTVTDFSSLSSAVSSLASTGGTIYVNAKEISCSSQLTLSSTKGKTISIVGVKQSDGTYPVLNFKPMRDSMIGSAIGSLKASSDSAVGVRITGSNYVLKNLIVEKAGDNGIQIKGSSANNNKIENCIVRYNNDAGLQITGGASNNTIRFVYSYRNCDVYSLGGNADGFAPKLGATTGNSFYGCYAWDNSDDGWDSFDKTTSGYTNDLSYEWCACWNNGNSDVFTGKYDYDNGNSLDTNLFLVELISKQDSSFASNYSKGSFSLPSGNIVNTSAGKISISSWTGSNYDGNPNGFKFGSVNSGSSLTRTVKNCLSFDHGKKGFDNNNSKCTGYFENCVSFDNGYNYYLPVFTIKEWSNMVGFDGTSKDKLPSGYSSSSSSKEASIRSTVESTRKSIVSQCDNNIIPGEVYFNIF